MTPSLTLIVAYSDNRAIGRDNAPCGCRGSGAFQAQHAGSSIIMGRKTWDSLGRPLPGAPISSSAAIRISRRKAPSWWRRWKRRRGLAGMWPRPSSSAARRSAQALARRVLATEVHARVEGDAFFPLLPAFQWKETARERQPAENGYEYDFVTYERA